jgi:hypothetical protein
MENKYLKIFLKPNKSIVISLIIIELILLFFIYKAITSLGGPILPEFIFFIFLLIPIYFFLIFVYRKLFKY